MDPEEQAIFYPEADHLEELFLDALRFAWESGFRLARAYGDNHAHFQGEQKERQWQEIPQLMT